MYFDKLFSVFSCDTFLDKGIDRRLFILICLRGDHPSRLLQSRYRRRVSLDILVRIIRSRRHLPLRGWGFFILAFETLSLVFTR